MQIAIAQLNATLGDFVGNKNKILKSIKKAAAAKCQLCIFPESTLFGYHPFDLLEREDLVEQQLRQIQTIQKGIPKGMGVIFGVLTLSHLKLGKPYFNSAVFLEHGKAPKFFHKQLLPTGDVFDEARFIEHGKIADNVFTFAGKKILMTICEDIWAWPESDGSSQYRENPLLAIKEKFDLVVNISASPYYPNKLQRRHQLVKQTARQLNAPMIYVNLVGAQDEIVFDGDSFGFDAKGAQLFSCAKFREDFKIFDLDEVPKLTKKSQPADITSELNQALILGIQDFCLKTGMTRVHLGLSGGIDSALVACLASEAVGPENVTVVAMPGPFSSPKSLKLAKQQAKKMGVHFLSAPIGSVYKAAQKQIATSFGIKQFGITHENLQARSRGMLLMALANSENSLLLSTGNKSEYATGYSTLYGDMCGGLAPIGDLTKQQVYAVAALYGSVIPAEVFERPPTAELRANQKDQDSLPAYDVLDRAVVNLVENCKPPRNSTEKWLAQRLLSTEFKRWQAAPILKVSKRSFGRGRRYPVAKRIV